MTQIYEVILYDANLFQNFYISIQKNGYLKILFFIFIQNKITPHQSKDIQNQIILAHGQR